MSMNKKLIIVLLVICAWAMPAVAGVRARMVHIIARADVNQVRLDTMYILAKTDANETQACVDLPQNASNIDSDDPNLNINAQTRTVCKRLSGAVFDSIEVAYSLPNENGSCKIDLHMPLAADAVIVYLSGQQSKLHSSSLKFDRAIAEKTKYSSAYSAKSIPADSNVSFMLDSLPQQGDDKIYRRIVFAGIAIIVFAAIVVLFYSKDADGTGSQKSQ